MSGGGAAPETMGVTVELLGTVDLGPEIAGLAGRELRMRRVTLAPGGVFGPVHDHKDRPGLVYILQGTITDHPDGATRDYGPGLGWPEDRNTRHWLENRGTVPAVEISVDIVRKQGAPVAPTAREVVERLYAAFARRDVPAMLALLDPEVEWGEPENPFNPACGTRHGHAGFLEWIEIGRSAEEILLLEPRRTIADGDAVAVVGFMRCRALATGRVYESDFVHLVTVEGGRVTKFQEFFDTHAAGEAFR